MSTDISKAKWYRSSVGVISVVFLGAIGSGLWELFLKDFLIKSYAACGSILGTVFSGYLDELHEGIGKGDSNEVGVVIFLSMIVLVVFSNIVGAILILAMGKISPESESESDLETEDLPEIPAVRKLKPLVVVIVLMSIFNVIAYSHQGFSILYRMRAVTWVERSIEIVRPSITEKEFLELRAKYRSVESAAGFYSLSHELIKYASKANIKLPELSVVGGPTET